jgi:hypothetical protein
MFVETVDMPKNFEHLRTRLKIEQARLLNWGENIGLVEELLEHPSQTLKLNQNLILDILVQIQAAFKAGVKIESKFGEIVGEGWHASVVEAQAEDIVSAEDTGCPGEPSTTVGIAAVGDDQGRRT